MHEAATSRVPAASRAAPGTEDAPLDATVIVVGGGIAGLAAAWELSRRSPPGRFLLLEAEPRLGGKILTERPEGFVVEGGPDSFLAVKPEAVQLCREVGIEDRLRGTDPERRRSFVRRRGRLHQLPAGITGLVPSRIGPLVRTSLLSPPGRVRAGLELFVPRRRGEGEESIAAFVRRRFGREAYDWLVEPLLSGIYAGDGRRLSLHATFPRLAEIERERGSILRGVLSPRPGPPSRTATAGFLSLEGGLATLVEAIRARLPAGSVRSGTRVRELARDGALWTLELQGGGQLRAPAVVLATPAWASAATLRRAAPALAAELEGIPFVSTAIVTLAWPASALPRPLEGYGYVSPRAEGGQVVACSWTSTKFPGRAPDGWAMVRVFVGRAGAEVSEAQDDGELATIARVEVRETLGIEAAPELVRVHRWLRGMPQYEVGHLARLERIDAAVAATQGLVLAGASYRGVGVPDCIRSGREAAKAALRFVER